MIERIHPSPSSLPGEWLSLTIRWLFMAALPTTAGLLGLMSDQVFIVILAWIGLSLAATLLRLGGWRPEFLSSASIVIDTILGLSLIAVTGWQVSPLWWCLLMEGVHASLETGLRSGGLVLTTGLGLGALLAWIAGGMDFLTLGAATLQAALVLGGGVVIALPLRGVVKARPAWSEDQRQAAAVRRHKDRQYTGQLSQLASEINATLEPTSIFSAGLELCQLLLGDDGPHGQGISGAVFQRQGDELVLVASQKPSPGDWPANRAVVDNGGMAEYLEHGMVRIIETLTDEPAFLALCPAEEWGQALVAPLRAGTQSAGLMILGQGKEGRFSPGDVEMAEVIAQQIGVALTNALQYTAMVEERDRIQEIQEEVRKKLARDLHDGPTQVVAAVAMRVNFARRLLERDQAAAAEELLKVENMARRTTKEIRHMLFTLRPLILESQGLVAALKQLVDKTIETHGQLTYLELDPDLETSLGLERESVVFFIAEEAINNARKHAAAAHIWVRLLEEGDWFILEVEDDGAGFNVGAVDKDYEQRGSLGMVNMRERAELVDGELHIESTEGVGTLVRLKVPMMGRELEFGLDLDPDPEEGETREA